MRRANSRIIPLSCFLCALGWGCSSQPPPNDPNKTAVESKLRSELKLKEIRLTVIEPGKYEGAGTGENETTYKLKATYRQNKSNGKPKSEFEYEAQDSKGNALEGYVAGDLLVPLP
jgi:hypothetical protein